MLFCEVHIFIWYIFACVFLFYSCFWMGWAFFIWICAASWVASGVVTSRIDSWWYFLFFCNWSHSQPVFRCGFGNVNWFFCLFLLLFRLFSYRRRFVLDILFKILIIIFFFEIFLTIILLLFFFFRRLICAFRLFPIILLQSLMKVADRFRCDRFLVLFLKFILVLHNFLGAFLLNFLQSNIFFNFALPLSWFISSSRIQWRQFDSFAIILQIKKVIFFNLTLPLLLIILLFLGPVQQIELVFPILCHYLNI